MKQRRNIVASCLACLLAMAAAAGILLLREKDKEVPVKEASSYEQLELFVKFPHADMQRVRAWKAEDGIYYFFLPSGCELCKVTFGNLGRESILSLGDITLSAEDSVQDKIDFSRQYEMKLQPGGSEDSLNPVQAVFMKSEGLPAVFIDIAPESLETIRADKSAKEPGVFTLIGADGKQEYSEELEYIKTRGNATFYRDKKSYQIRLKKSRSLLDMPRAEKWILLSNSMDDTLMKNKLVFDYTAEYTEVPSIRSNYVDVYVNGDYAGNYLLCEKIEVGADHVNIRDLEEATEAVNFREAYRKAKLYVSEDGRLKATEGLQDPEDITGGYLLEYISAEKYAEATNAFITDMGSRYEIISPAPATVHQAEYIRNFMNELETAVMREDGTNPDTGKYFTEYIDIDSWAAKYQMEEMFHDPDAGGASMFFYKDADSADGRLHSGPVWDYDRTLGSYGYGSLQLYLDGANTVGECGVYIDGMMQHKEVRDLVYDRFLNIGIPYAEYLAASKIYALSGSIRNSAEMDRMRWPEIYGHYSDITAAGDYLIYYLKQRAERLQEIWLEGEEYCRVRFLDYYGNVFAEYSVKKGECITDVPEIATWVAVFAGWFTQDDGIAFDPRLPVLQDETYESRWIDLDILLTNGINGAGLDINQVDPEIFDRLADQFRKMREENLRVTDTVDKGAE